jgi:hypothetical protein
MIRLNFACLWTSLGDFDEKFRMSWCYSGSKMRNFFRYSVIKLYGFVDFLEELPSEKAEAESYTPS